MKLTLLGKQENAHDDGVWSAAWAPSSTDTPGGVVVSGSVDETVKVWQVGDSGLQPERTNAGHSLGVVSVAVDPLGTLAASSSLDSIVRVFEVRTNEQKAALESPPAETWGVAFSPSGKQLAVAGGGSGTVKLWSMESFQQEGSLEIPLPADGGLKRAQGRFVLAVAYNMDGTRLAASTMDGTIAIFDVAASKFLHSLDGHHMPVRSLAWSPTGPRILYTASDDCHSHVYDAEGKELIAALSGHGSWVLSVSASPDGTALVTGSSDRTVRLWDLNLRSCAQVLSDHGDQVWGVAFRPTAPGEEPSQRGGSRLVTVSDDKSIALYDFS